MGAPERLREEIARRPQLRLWGVLKIDIGRATCKDSDQRSGWKPGLTWNKSRSKTSLSYSWQGEGLTDVAYGPNSEMTGTEQA